MLKQFSAVLPLVFLGMVSCQSKPSSTDKAGADSAKTTTEETASPVAKLATGPVDKAAVLARKQVPVVCYHQIRDWKATDSVKTRKTI
jgi:hypothetical protein